MSKNHIAKKYSRAIISSVDLTKVPQIVEEFKRFSRLIEENRKLRLLFAGQIFSEIEKEKAFKAIAPRLNFDAGTEKFLRLMIVQGDLSAIREIISSTINTYNERQKKATAVVVSSIALDTKFTERLKNALKQMTKRDIIVENKIDESLLGGFIVRVGSTIYDSSLKGQLRLLKTELLR